MNTACSGAHSSEYGEPVHCMILLGHAAHAARPPPGGAGGADVQSQLYTARSPAHAYEAIHAEQAEDFNYYLSD